MRLRQECVRISIRNALCNISLNQLKKPPEREVFLIEHHVFKTFVFLQCGNADIFKIAPFEGFVGELFGKKHRLFRVAQIFDFA